MQINFEHSLLHFVNKCISLQRRIPEHIILLDDDCDLDKHFHWGEQDSQVLCSALNAGLKTEVEPSSFGKTPTPLSIHQLFLAKANADDPEVAARVNYGLTGDLPLHHKREAPYVQ